MRVIKFLFFLLLTQSSCGQNQANNSKETFAAILHQSCDCSSKSVSTGTAFNYVDSCFNLSIKQHYKQLTSLGIDTTTEMGRNKLRNGLDLLNGLRAECPAIYNNIMAEYQEIESKKIKFQGAFVSQQKLANGQYKLILKKLKTGETQEFISDANFISEEEIKKYLPGDENVIVEYEILKDSDNKPYNKVKTVSTIGAILKENN